MLLVEVGLHDLVHPLLERQTLAEVAAQAAVAEHGVIQLDDIVVERAERVVVQPVEAEVHAVREARGRDQLLGFFDVEGKVLRGLAELCLVPRVQPVVTPAGAEDRALLPLQLEPLLGELVAVIDHVGVRIAVD